MRVFISSFRTLRDIVLSCVIVTQGRSCLNFHLCTYLFTRVWSLDYEALSYYIAMATFAFEIRDVSLSIKPFFSSLKVKRIW